MTVNSSTRALRALELIRAINRELRIGGRDDVGLIPRRRDEALLYAWTREHGFRFGILARLPLHAWPDRGAAYLPHVNN